MEESTPISQLNNRDNKTAVADMSYADILGQMKKDTPLVVNQQSMDQPSLNQPSLNQPSLNQPSLNQPSQTQYSTNQPLQPLMNQSSMITQPTMSRHAMDQTSTHLHTNYHDPLYYEKNKFVDTVYKTNKNTAELKNTEPHNEMGMLLMVYVMIHTIQFQNIMRLKLPSMFNTNTTNINIFGTIINGVLLILIWSVVKKLVMKYMKDFTI
jgi:hypothetical protein